MKPEKQGLSVIMPCYKAGSWVEAAVSSLIAHNVSRLPMEVILVDDGSPDHATHEALERLERTTFPSEFSLKVVRLEKNTGGPSAPRNHALSLARYDYILPFDADDLMNNDQALLEEGSFFERAVQALEANHDLAIVSMNWRKFSDRDGFNVRQNVPLPYSEKTMVLFNLLPNCSMYRRDDALLAEGYDTQSSVQEDWIFFLKLLNARMEKGLGLDVQKLDGQYLLYRQHDNGENIDARPRDWESIYKIAVANAPTLYGKYFPETVKEDFVPRLVDRAMNCQVCNFALAAHDDRMRDYAVDSLAQEKGLARHEAAHEINMMLKYL